MKKEVILSVVCSLLALLFLYTAFSKLADFGKFKMEMYNQVFAHRIADLVSYVLPVMEILAGGLLLVPKFRFVGLVLCLGLLVIFTGYIGLILMGLFNRVPCSCGGVLAQMGWNMHLYFNIFFIAIAVLGIAIEKCLIINNWFNNQKRKEAKKKFE